MTEFLNWQTDPLLIDPTTLKQNNWLTANELLETSQSKRFLTAKGQIQLYPIMIRKVDFVSGERILQSFPYIILNQVWIAKIRKNSLACAEKIHYYFTDSNVSKSIRSWQKRIISYLEEQPRLPFPLFRLFSFWEEFFQGKQFIPFQSARGEDFQLPLYLTEDLAYLTGVIMGDGHLANYFINIIDNSKEHIENLVKLLKETFCSRTEFFKQQNAQAWNVNILGKWLVRFFNFLSGQLINERKYPSLREPLIFQNNSQFRRVFWRGLMDADGSYKANIGFGTASKKLLYDFSDYLKQHNIKHRFYTQNVFGGTTHSLTIAGDSRQQFATLIETSHPQKEQELQSLLARKIYQFTQNTDTLRKQGYWQGQIVDFQKEKLIDGYFDFSYIPKLSVSHLGTYIRSLRRVHKHTQLHLAKSINIVRSMLSNYESNKTSIPIAVLLRMFDFYNVSLKSFLSKQSNLNLHSRSSHCLIETQPSETMLTLLHGLQFKERGYIMLHGQVHESKETYKQKVGKYFSIIIPATRFHNSALITFVREFFILRN